MERENTDDLIHHDNTPTVGDEIGEAAGGISGVVAGAAIGSAGGPVGTIIGGIAGALGGWWAGRAVSEAAKRFTRDDDQYYRNHYETTPTRLADQSYDQVRPAYQLGHIAGQNPEYNGRPFEEVETDLRRGWDNAQQEVKQDWNKVRDHARTGYHRASDSVERELDYMNEEDFDGNREKL